MPSPFALQDPTGTASAPGALVTGTGGTITAPEPPSMFEKARRRVQNIDIDDQEPGLGSVRLISRDRDLSPDQFSTIVDSYRQKHEAQIRAGTLPKDKIEGVDIYPGTWIGPQFEGLYQGYIRPTIQQGLQEQMETLPAPLGDIATSGLELLGMPPETGPQALAEVLSGMGGKLMGAGRAARTVLGRTRQQAVPALAAGGAYAGAEASLGTDPSTAALYGSGVTGTSFLLNKFSSVLFGRLKQRAAEHVQREWGKLFEESGRFNIQNPTEKRGFFKPPPDPMVYFQKVIQTGFDGLDRSTQEGVDDLFTVLTAVNNSTINTARRHPLPPGAVSTLNPIFSQQDMAQMKQATSDIILHSKELFKDITPEASRQSNSAITQNAQLIENRLTRGLQTRNLFTRSQFLSGLLNAGDNILKDRIQEVFNIVPSTVDGHVAKMVLLTGRPVRAFSQHLGLSAQHAARIEGMVDRVWNDVSTAAKDLIIGQIRGMAIQDSQTAAAIQLFKQAGVASNMDPVKMQQYLMQNGQALAQHSSGRGQLLADTIDIAFRGSKVHRPDITEYEGIGDLASSLLSKNRNILGPTMQFLSKRRGTTFSGPNLPPQIPQKAGAPLAAIQVEALRYLTNPPSEKK